MAGWFLLIFSFFSLSTLVSSFHSTHPTPHPVALFLDLTPTHASTDIPIELESETVDLSAFRSLWPLEGEELLPEESAERNDEATYNVDMSHVDQLMTMGFSRNRSIRALQNTGNSGAEVAMEWLFSKMDDACMSLGWEWRRWRPPSFSMIALALDEPIVAQPAAATAVNPAQVQSLQDMGFTAQQARKALKETVCGTANWIRIVGGGSGCCGVLW